MAGLSVLVPAIQAEPRHAEPILDYIRTTWATLTRNNRTLATSAQDPKFHPEAGGRWPVYISAREDRAGVEEQLRKEVTADDLRQIDLRVLPADASNAPPAEAGLLYLPHPYVVPGGRFNEMYGWDSYFIVRGLLRDGMVKKAQNVVDDFLYEIRNYGKILNANRTYYLTRSQPPFLTEMVLQVYRRTHDRKWVEDALPAIETYYRYWMSEPHLTATGLSRYFDLGEGPAPEVIASERDPSGRTHYERVREYFRRHPRRDNDPYFDAKADRLKPLFYKGDRAMRESGFDPSGRFGPFSVDIIDYNPVCLNSLLYLMETQMAELMREIPAHAREADEWNRRARDRAAIMNRLMWNERDGLYEDYDLVHRRTRYYPFLTTFYPLWAGLATKEQAARVVGNLPLFEKPGGLQTSTTDSGDQWDAPFGWAPLELIAVEGLRRYGYRKEADRISENFLSMVAEQYRKIGAILEKYDVVRRSGELNREIRFGYKTNEAGFGWTNAVFTNLLDELPAPQQARILGR